MDGIFVYGGENFVVKSKCILAGMDYYYILENVNTHQVVYLTCYGN